MKKINNKITDFKYLSLNIISSLYLSNIKIKSHDKIFNHIIANISIKRDDELVLTDDNLKLICFRLYSLGYNCFNINIFNKNYDQKFLIKNIDISELLSELSDKPINSKEIIFNVNYINVKFLLNLEFIKILLNSSLPNICIFQNMSWLEVITYFRKNNYIVSGGKISERHIMNDSRYLLAIFLKSINNINLISDGDNLYTSTSSLLNVYRYNTKELMKYIKSNINLISEEIDDKYIDNVIKYYNNKYDVSNELNKEILLFNKNKLFIDKFYELLDKKITKNDLSLFIININDEYKFGNISSVDYHKIHAGIKDYVYNHRDISEDIKLEFIELIKNIINKIKDKK